MMAVFDHDCKGYKVRIENLDIDTSRAQLMVELETFGVVRKCWLPNTSGGSAYAVFNSANGANNAVRKLDGRHLSGRRVRMEHAQPSPYQGKQSRKQDGPSDRDILPYHAIKSLLKPRPTFMTMSSTTSRSRSTSRKKCNRSRSESNHSSSRSRHYTSRSRAKVRSKSRSKTRSWSRSRSRSRSNARSRRRHRRRWYRSSRKSDTRRRRKHHRRSSSRSTSRSNSESRSSSSSGSSSRSRSSSSSSSGSRRSFKSRVSKKHCHFGYYKCDDGSTCHGSRQHRSAENKVQGWIRSQKRESHYDDGCRSKNNNHDFGDTEMTAKMSVNSFYSVDDAQLTIPSNNANEKAVRDKIRVTFSCKKQMKRTVYTPAFDMRVEDNIPDVKEASTASSSSQATDATAADRIISREQSSTKINKPIHPVGGIAAAPFPLPTSCADIGTTHAIVEDQHCLFYDESTRHVRTVFTELLNNENSRGSTEHGNGVEQNGIHSMGTCLTGNASVVSMSKAAVQATSTRNGGMPEHSNVHSKGTRQSNLPDNPPANTADNNVLIISVNDDSF